jgi:putative tryptophan/tyrosine transport system substrate-binding protein
MNRRDTVLALTTLFAAPLVAKAQQTGKVWRIGFLGGSNKDNPNVAAFRDELRKLGWIEGKNIFVEYRFAGENSERFPALMAELVSLKVDLIVTASTAGALAAKAATQDVPVVFSMVSAPVASGLVANLARPGGNLTGWSNMLPETSAKLLELLKEVMPNGSRVAVLFDPANPGKVLEIKVLQAAAERLRLTLRSVPVRGLSDIKAAFAAMTKERPDGLVVLQDSVTSSHREAIAQSAAGIRLPAIYQVSEFVDAGGLMSYGMNMVRQYRRSAFYADKILKGAKPAELPVEQPTTFELVINLKAAKTIGTKIPNSILQRADRVIE